MACKRPAHEDRGGFSLLEVLIVVSLVMVALLALSASIGKSMDLNEVNAESALATDGLREMVEILQGVEDFGAIYAMYNDDLLDDEEALAPGSGFDVPGLSPVEDDPDGFVGEIRFPVAEGDFGPELREDLQDESLGMPRDLNGDGEVDGENHADDYRLLPVLLRLRWQGASGVRTMELGTLIADR